MPDAPRSWLALPHSWWREQRLHAARRTEVLQASKQSRFDIRVRDAEGVTIAYVEVKSTAGPEPVFFLSERERLFAENFTDRYHLLVATSVDTELRTGEIRWRDGALDGHDIVLRPRQWHGRLR